MNRFDPANRRINLLGPTQVPGRVFRTKPIQIPAKGAESFGVSRALKDNLRESIEKILNERAHLDHYFIVVKCNLLPNRFIQNKIVIVHSNRTKEEFAALCKSFNTMCFYVDNKAGTIEDVWILPKDTVLSAAEVVGKADRYSEKISRSAEGLPTLN